MASTDPLRVIVDDWDALEPAPGRPHLLPFKIRHTGTARVSTFFKPQPIANQHFVDAKGKENALLEARCRGRKLIGFEVAVPANYTGLVFRETDSSVANLSVLFGDDVPADLDVNEPSRVWTVQSKFSSFMSWSRKTALTSQDPICKWMEYIGDLSEAIHKPITNLDTELKFVVNKDAAVAAAENNAPETPAKAVSPKRAIRKKRGRDEEDDTEPNKRIKVEETEDDLVEQSDK